MVPKTYRKYVLKSDGTLQEVEFTVSARKIPLTEIRKRELQRCENLGLVRGYLDTEYEEMNNSEVKERLRKIGEFTREVEEKCTPRQMKELLMKYERTRHFMIWADNSTIMNHGHIMYLVQCLYDPAFFFTPEENWRPEGMKIWMYHLSLRDPIFIFWADVALKKLSS